MDIFKSFPPPQTPNDGQTQTKLQDGSIAFHAGHLLYAVSVTGEDRWCWSKERPQSFSRPRFQRYQCPFLRITLRYFFKLSFVQSLAPFLHFL